MAILIDADRIAGQLAVVGNVTYPPRPLTVQELTVAVTIMSGDVFVYGEDAAVETVKTAVDGLRQWLNASEIS